MLRMVDTCKGVELLAAPRSAACGGPSGLPRGLLPRNDWLLLVDESHVTAPQVKGMYEGDRRRKSNLEHGFRLPSAGQPPLRAEEFWSKSNQCVFISATPGKFERELSSTWNGGLGDSGAGNSMQAISDAVSRLATKPRFGAKGVGHRGRQWRRLAGRPRSVVGCRGSDSPHGSSTPRSTFVRRMGRSTTCCTRSSRAAPERARAGDHAYKKDGGRPRHLLPGLGGEEQLHPLEREAPRTSRILQSLREGGIDVLVGVNLLREGLNLPEVSLVAILDADKRAFCGATRRSSRPSAGPRATCTVRRSYMPDMVTKSMQRALDETSRRRAIQLQYNEKTGKVPTTATSVRGTTEDSILETIQHFHASNGNGPRSDAGKMSFSEFEAMKDGDSAALLGWKKEDDPIALGALRLAAHEKMQSASAAREYDEAMVGHEEFDRAKLGRRKRRRQRWWR